MKVSLKGIGKAVAEAIAFATGNPILMRLVNLALHNVEVRQSFAEQVAKQHAEATGETDPVAVQTSLEAINTFLDHVARRLAENAAIDVVLHEIAAQQATEATPGAAARGTRLDP